MTNKVKESLENRVQRPLKMRLEFCEWKCGQHHQDCPKPIEFTYENEDDACETAVNIISAISAAISLPGSAKAYWLDNSGCIIDVFDLPYFPCPVKIPQEA